MNADCGQTGQDIYEHHRLRRCRRGSKRKFSPSEDELIINLVGGEQFPDWRQIAHYIPNKTPRQVRERYQHYLAPEITSNPWTPADQNLLESLFNMYGPNWALLTRFFPGRTNMFLKNRWHVAHRRRRRCARREMMGYGFGMPPVVPAPFDPQPMYWPIPPCQANRFS